MKKQIILSCLVLASFLSTNQTQAQTEPYLGNIVMFAGNFAPRGWAFCEGQLLSINDHQALFSLLGTTYGGDGRTTFALPDLRGRAPVSVGNGPGLTDRRLGQKFGQETVTLNVNQMPSHNHGTTTTANIAVSTDSGTELNADGNVLANHDNAFNTAATSETTLAGVNSTLVVANNGGSQSHNNIQPSIAINYIIALQGLFPSRN